MKKVLPVICLSFALFLCSGRAEEPLVVGNSVVTRGKANFGLHIPAVFAEKEMPGALLVFFGGSGDSVAAYQRSLTPIGDTEQMVVVIPQMPWFSEPAEASTTEIFRELKDLVKDIETQFATGPLIVAVGGASAGGSAAHELAKKWSSQVEFFILSSTGPFPKLSQPRTFHVVAESEKNRLGSQGDQRNKLGKGKTDIFLIPDGKHSAQIPHWKIWLETELAALRLEQAEEILRAADEQMRRGDKARAATLLALPLSAVETLRQDPSDQDEFFQYEGKSRAELLEKYAATVKKLDEAKIQIQP